MGRVRIIAGNLKGRRLEVLDGPGLRPTPDRAREALFSILGSRVCGARVLDAYAGTGALGFEALSRGARHVVFVESSPAAAAQLERARARLGCLDVSRVQTGDVVALFDRGGLAGPFDLILADPPYGSGEHDRFLAALGRHRPVAPGGWLVLEDEAQKTAVSGAEPAGLTPIRQSTYGRSLLHFYEAVGES
ncbi:MAG: 16S rRNA (guanine(966)-N(2))-methyltransferase RsmD [Acidobacteria bacterium]|nr:16S rRNA (guanine(966)-N(2))-methyltransferase RsmD [Acidobacteriota bacterium]NIM63090.1 16S rRNA (guanine(966)-N(2))-methyltransferase RsmD [Acidobacteriota bacterium]NIO60801.1 16S rRNA (guanine(966)-N(2))-methyltransferase RsmD [Acidobacteriota bacterium]NIQ31873.1 16S rRNA (guanine(966)-N(2))-methyltransferase RsmD [Acidobacteriota bacterium]NIQ87250.1 16S rRNA (guanine(966)-N(2))-methyltransferase RsmD [Acidobacteriota bacterium]